MPKPIKLTETIDLVATDEKNWDGQPLLNLVLHGEHGDRVIGSVYRATHSTPIMAKGSNYSIGTRKRSGWEWRVKSPFAREIGMLNGTFRRTTSYLLFTSKQKAATDLAELITARMAA